MRRTLGLVAICVMVISSAAPDPAMALPEYERIITYYTGCGSEPEYLVETGVDCFGGHYGTYTGGAKWKTFYEALCDWPYWWSLTYYEYCSSTGWKVVSAADFNAGNCSCA